jgi:4'-phosphopantetheinyl transferase
MITESEAEPGIVWPVPDSHPTLGESVIHVWCAEVAVDGARAEALLAKLSADERERAGRYLFDRHRWRFIACRAAQRLILARYVETPPEKLEFVYSALGKPTLAASAGELKFNVSNSGDLALFAVTRGCELGVDLERIRTNIDHDGLAQRFFAADERDKLRRLPQGEQLTGFFDCWTRKEAFLKAIGKGLTFPLDRAVVSVGPDEPCRLLSLDGSEAEASTWSLVALSPATGYVAAIALAGPTRVISTFRWQWE